MHGARAHTGTYMYIGKHVSQTDNGTHWHFRPINVSVKITMTSPKLRWIDNVTKWSVRSVEELRRAAIERHQVRAATPGVRPHYNLRTRRPRTQVYAE